MSTPTDITDLPRLSDEERSALDDCAVIAGVPDTKPAAVIPAAQLQRALDDLGQVDSMVIVSIVALRSPSCEVTEDIATVLDNAWQRVTEIRERVESVLATMTDAQGGSS